MVDYKAIGRRIAFYRKKASITQAVLSEKLGVSEGYISQLERGSAKIPLPRLVQIADFLGVDVALLVSDRAVVSDVCFNSDIFEIIKDWPAEYVSFLTEMLICANDRLNHPKK
jgi:transcriptional regulator with XRE-family HTH domain